MRILKRLIAVIAVLGLTAAMMSMLDYCFTDDAGTITRLMMHEFYAQEDIDILFVGASHYSDGIDPAIISERTGKRVFNASSVGQRMDVSLALVKEALDRYTPEHIYLDTSYWVASLGEIYKQRTRDDLWAVYTVSDYMHWSRNKLELLLNASSSELYPVTFFIPHHIMDSPQAVLDNLRRKSSAEYKNYAYTFAADENAYYGGNGYFGQTTAAPNFYISEETFMPCSPESIDEDWKNSVRKIIDVCAEHDTPLTLLGMPFTGCWQLAQTGQDRYTDFLCEFTAGTGVDVVDFNTLNTDIWPDDPALMFDCDHLNDAGAKKFDILLADYLNGTLPDGAFLPSAAARAAELPAGFYGLSYMDDKAEGTLTLRAAAKGLESQEIRLSCQTADGEQIFDAQVPVGEDVTLPLAPRTDITVTYKLAGAPDSAAVTETQSLYISQWGGVGP